MAELRLRTIVGRVRRIGRVDAVALDRSTFASTAMPAASISQRSQRTGRYCVDREVDRDQRTATADCHQMRTGARPSCGAARGGDPRGGVGAGGSAAQRDELLAARSLADREDRLRSNGGGPWNSIESG